MEWPQIIILALVQGLTEFLPVSSSAHLILPQQLTDWPDQGLAFDVAVHVGTLLAVLAYFRREMVQFAAGSWACVAQRRLNPDAEMVLKLGAATVPVVVAGLLLKDRIETDFRSVPVIAWASIGFGLLLLLADRLRGARDSVSWRDVGVIGLMQTLSLIPGTSRAGITLTAALLLGLSRVAGARFSFLLSIPTIAGAGILMAADAAAEPLPHGWQPLAAGALLSGVAAFACIRAFIALLEWTGMTPYVIYRIALGGLLLALWHGLWP